MEFGAFDTLDDTLAQPGDTMTLSQLNSTKSVHNVSKILHPIKYIKHMKPPQKNDSLHQNLSIHV